MKHFKLLTIIALGFTFNVSYAQIGVGFQYHQSKYETWTDVLKDAGNQDSEIFRQSFKLSLDYGFGLRQYRVNFHPELSYKKGVFGDENLIDHDIFAELTQYGFHFRTQAYPLDLLSKKGMQCPSFNRGGDVFTKGWFISFQPELIYSKKELSVSPLISSDNDSGESKMIFGFGFGTGIDIGINEYFSITPSVMYSFILGENWPGYAKIFNQDAFNDPTNVSYVAAGLRLGLWF
jgi:hypothetical protein